MSGAWPVHEATLYCVPRQNDVRCVLQLCICIQVHFCGQVVAAFQERFLPRVVVALKKEVRRLSASSTMISVDMAHLGDEEGNAGAARSAGGGEGGEDESRAARKSEKVSSAGKQDLRHDGVCTVMVGWPICCSCMFQDIPKGAISPSTFRIVYWFVL